jgi:Tol biopolymer transport system component
MALSYVFLGPDIIVVPVNLDPPIIVGTAQVGRRLIAFPGTWTVIPTTFTYQWNRSGAPIPGATSETYVPTSDDALKVLSVTVTASNEVVSGAPATSPIPQFGVFSSTFSGGPAALLVSDANREINHFRRSPTNPLIAVATQYNNFNSQHLAFETGDYTNTQVNLYDLSGDSVTVIAPAVLGQVAAGPSWSPDGTRIYWTSSRTASGKFGLARYMIPTGVTSIIYDPVDINMGDYELNQQSTAFAAAGAGSIWILYQGGRVRFTAGNDTDPHWSPDGTKIAFSRKLSGVARIVVAGIGPAPTFTNLGEVTFAPPGSAQAFDGPPSWSPDGKTLLSWHIDPQDFSSNTLFVINPDGSGRRDINSIANTLKTEPYFHPSNGTSFDFSASLMPVLPATSSSGPSGGSLNTAIAISSDSMPVVA